MIKVLFSILFCVFIANNATLIEEERAIFQQDDNVDVTNREGFVVLNQKVNSFEEAEHACIADDLTIGVVDTIEKFALVKGIVQEKSIYIGLKRKTVPESFDFVDNLENQDKTFFSNSFEEPWSKLSPRRHLTDVQGDESCVSWTVTGWVDVDCSTLTSVLCSTDCQATLPPGLGFLSQCINDIFKVIALRFTAGNIDEAVEACGALDNERGNIIRITSSDEFEQVQAAFIGDGREINFFVGLYRENGFDITNPLLFSFTGNLDVDEKKDFFEFPRVEPWAATQPGDKKLEDEACVEYNGEEGLLNDISCTSQEKHVLCQAIIPIQTNSPTKIPTPLPSKSPTSFPSNSPTASPTRFPTKSPTPTPTESPTKFPTKAPFISPTQPPTKSPTKTLDSETSLKEESLANILNNFWTFLSIGFLLIFVFIVFFFVKELLIIKNKGEKIKELKKKLERYSEDCSESI